MTWCLPPKQVERFKKAILSRRIDPERLAEMSSAERRAVFEKEIGKENAEPINTEFERKLLLKNRQQGYINWAQKVLGDKTPVARDVISRIQRMDKILSSVDEQAFLEDLAAARLGTRIDFGEAKRITELSKKIGDAKITMEKGGNRLEYGLSLVNLKNYVGDLKTQAGRMSVAEFKRQPFRSVGKITWTGLQTAKALKAAWDASSIFRPGIKTLLTHPGVWQKNARQQFVDIWHAYGGKQVMDSVNADILSRPNSLNGYYKKGKVDLGITEEAYPTDVPERASEYLGRKIEKTGVPIVSKVIGRAVGKTYKASQDAYSAFNTRTRADLFDKYVEIAKKSGQELDDQNLSAIGRMVNSLVGRGRLGALEPVSKYVNVPFFSPKLLKSHIDVLLEPLSGGGEGIVGQEGGTNFVRKQSALNLLKIIGGTAAALGAAKALKNDSVDFDPLSANAGKVRIRDTRFDLTGGWASIATLASRLATMKTKSSTTGEVRKINERDEEGKLKYGTETAKDLIYDFFENKYSPPFAVARDLLAGETRAGEQPTALTTVRDLYEPLPLANIRELKNNPNSAPMLLALIADGLGIATNTYSQTPQQKESFEKRQRGVTKEGFVERLRRGQNADLDSAVQSEQITEADRKAIEKQSQMTPFQVTFENAFGDKALDRYERLVKTGDPRAREVEEIMSKKAWSLLHSDSLTQKQKDDFQVRIDALGITLKNPQKKSNSFIPSFRSRFSQQGARP